MKDYYGYQNDMLIMKHVTMDEFQEKYKEIAYGENTLITATTIMPIMESGGASFRDPKDDMLRYDICIFFKIKEDVEKPVMPKKQQKPKLKLTL